MNDMVFNAQKGDEFAVEIVIQECKSWLKSICRGYFLTSADSDDIMQEAMIGLIQAIKTYNIDKNDTFLAFAYMVVNRRLMSLIRSNSRQRFLLHNSAISIDHEGAVIGDADIQSPIVAISEDDIEENFVAKEIMMASDIIIRDILSPIDYQILQLYLSGYKYAEIAAQLTLTAKQIDHRLQSIKKKLISNKSRIKGE